MLSAFTILITLNAIANPTSAAVQKEIAEIFKKNPDKEIIVKVESEQKNTENVAKFESLGNWPDQDPYDQIKGYVEPQDMDYFNQLRAYQETKDENEKIKCKAVIYAILQDTVLTQEQKEILALAQFEILARMPGSDYRFSKKSSALTTSDLKYKEKTQWYYAYKTYLTGLELDKEIADLREQNKLLQQLLNWYNDK